ncbi:MAG: hypothetical protein KBD76_02920 [Bacteriovorax sp.]|jgi:cellulose biosynthesis protein BcsQ|nr:hypothetical protein [Bacteriovorax sp.]
MTNQKKNISVWEIGPVSSVLQKIHFQFVTKKLRSLSVVSEHRLEGKTTLSILIARGLKEIYNLNVLLVDLNPQGDILLSKYLGDYSSHEGIVEGHPFDFSLFRVKDLDVDWSKNLFDGPFLNTIVTNFTAQYDIVIVDNFVPADSGATLLKVNTDTNIIIRSSSGKKTDKVQKELELNRKHLMGIILNK